MIEKYKFCLWLVNKLLSRRLTLEEIIGLWDSSPQNISGRALNRRTFHRHKALAEEIFGVNIECDRSANEYWIDTEALGEADRWTLNALRIQNLASMAGMRKHIVLEPAPSGQRLLEAAAAACSQSRLLEFDYKSPYKPARHWRAKPLFVRLFKQRWYLVCRPLGQDFTSTFALDRISGLAAGQPAEPDEIDPDEYYADCYGIIRQLQPERIVVRAFWPENAYLKEVPMHRSQTIVAETPEWTDFSLCLRPTYDFKQGLLWHRDKLAVISPQWLRDDMIEIMQGMIDSYRSGLPNYKDE